MPLCSGRLRVIGNQTVFQSLGFPFTAPSGQTNKLTPRGFDGKWETKNGKEFFHISYVIFRKLEGGQSPPCSNGNDPHVCKRKIVFAFSLQNDVYIFLSRSISALHSVVMSPHIPHFLTILLIKNYILSKATFWTIIVRLT